MLRMRPVRTTLPGSPTYHRILRAIGLGTWVFLGLPILDSATRRGYETLTVAQWSVWLAFFWCFGPAFWYSSSPRARPPWTRIAALAIQTIAALGMTFILQDYFVGFLLVIVSWQSALLFAPMVAVAWTLAASVLLVLFLEPHYYMGWRWGATSAFVGFQVFALVTAALAQRESESRDDLARINAELVSTRELLRESSKLGERIRIARELHDSVGHHLTALCLHLEAALNDPGKHAATTGDLERAQQTARHALQEVRSIVSTLHDGEDIDLHAALRALAARLPRVRLTLSVPDELRVTDPARANAVLRCVQEVATNTLKHSDAVNLWITLRLDRGGLEIEARDDGRTVRRAASGFGLTAMRQRFEELGGDLSFERGSDRGFAVRAWLPTRDTARDLAGHLPASTLPTTVLPGKPA
jgi:signal transduction histidine kinase